MAYKRKSWREKLADDKGLPRVGPITGRMSTQKRRLESEGHKVIQKGKNHVVEDYEKHLV